MARGPLLELLIKALENRVQAFWCSAFELKLEVKLTTMSSTSPATISLLGLELYVRLFLCRAAS